MGEKNSIRRVICEAPDLGKSGGVSIARKVTNPHVESGELSTQVARAL